MLDLTLEMFAVTILSGEDVLARWERWATCQGAAIESALAVAYDEYPAADDLRVLVEPGTLPTSAPDAREP